MIHCQWMWKLWDIVATDKHYCAHLRLTMSYNYSWGCVALSNEKAPSRNYLFHCVSFLPALPTVSSYCTEWSLSVCVVQKYKCVSWLPPRCWQIDRLSDEDQHLWNVCVRKAFIVGESRGLWAAELVLVWNTDTVWHLKYIGYFIVAVSFY